MQILLVEDHARLAGLTRRALMDDGYMVDIATGGQEALDKFGINDYDLVILDVMLPEIDGVSVCKTIRRTDTDTPIIMLTARGSLEDRITGLDSGADDYLVKPFSFGELSARVRALLRRGKKAEGVVLKAGRLSLDPAAKSVSYDGRPLTLTAKEFTLLHYFMVHRGRVIPKTELLEHVWDMNYEGMSNVVETYVRYLRHKLARAGAGGKSPIIQTVRGLGYKLE